MATLNGKGSHKLMRCWANKIQPILAKGLWHYFPLNGFNECYDLKNIFVILWMAFYKNSVKWKSRSILGFIRTTVKKECDFILCCWQNQVGLGWFLWRQLFYKGQVVHLRAPHSKEFEEIFSIPSFSFFIDISEDIFTYELWRSGLELSAHTYSTQKKTVRVRCVLTYRK